MMIRQRESVAFRCDTCAVVIDTDEPTVLDAWPAAVRSGWRTRPVNNGRPVHSCPECEAA